jgi:flagellar hook-associated protein 1 FlgK
VVGKSTAALEDQRDVAVRELSKYMKITYFEDDSRTLIIQTERGQVLADSVARKIDFNFTRIGYNSAYPDNISGVTIDLGVGGGLLDLANLDVGGKLGALIKMRDETFPAYLAQLDEAAHKMATRFDAQGLRLFVDENNVVPADDPLAYLAMGSRIKVNPLVASDPSLVQQGTTGPSLNIADTTVVRKIIDYTFGLYADATSTPHTPFRTANLGAANQVNINMPTDNASLENYASAMIGVHATDNRILKETIDSERVYTSDVENRLLNQSGVNTDEEMGRLIELQQAYSSAAQVVTTLTQLFRDLLNAVG